MLLAVEFFTGNKLFCYLYQKSIKSNMGTGPSSPIKAPIVKDLANWMANLPNELKACPLPHLAIPGSHDSITYCVDKKSELGPDAPGILQKLDRMGSGPLLKSIMARWAKTQGVNITKQLKGGIRYLDFRIAIKRDEFYCVHGLFTAPVEPVLQYVNEFLQEHPGEIVIIDCQHTYQFGDNDHQSLLDLFYKVFQKTKIVPRTTSPKSISVKSLNEKKQQVIIIYRPMDYYDDCPLVWRGDDFPSRWPHTHDTDFMIEKLNGFLKNRLQNSFEIFQCVLTPASSASISMVSYACCSLKKRYVLPMERQKQRWIRNQKPGPNGVNIIISDFVELNNYYFAKNVIALNNKMLTNK